MGDVSSTLLVIAGTQVVTMAVRDFAIVNIVLIVVWVLLALRILKAQKSLDSAPA